MKIRRIWIMMLCIFLMIGFTVPAFAEAPADEDVVTIPTDLLDAMQDDFALDVRVDPFSAGNFIRSIQNRILLPSRMNAKAKVLRSSHDLARLDVACSAPGNAGCIGVVPAKLDGRAVTLIVLGGTLPGKGQANGMKEDALSAFELPNAYLRNVVALFDAKDADGNPVIPADRPVIVSGLSLGGMIAQQLLAQERVTSRFDLEAIICFGAPMLAPESRSQNTRVVRFADANDKVPLMGKTRILDMLGQKLLHREPSKILAELDAKELILRDGGYSNSMAAHSMSYATSPCWDGIDLMGVDGGNHELVLQRDVQFFANPRKAK